MSERHIELVWRCSSCQHSNLGRHMVCQSCGSPKDDSEEYEMPADPSQVASVTDDKLLEMAMAGENWKCAYCGSSARDQLDGSCKQCGAGRPARPEERPREATPSDSAVPARSQGRVSRARIVLAAIVGVALVMVTCVIAKRSASPTPERYPTVVTATTPPPPRTDFVGQVTAASWSRTIVVERWQLAPHEGFTAELPEGAVQVVAAGQKVHHHEEVFDHDETVYDDVTVPDGYKTETYTERVKCGEDCTTTPRTCRKVCNKTPRTCRQVCTNKKNGFASCREECSGGSETCRDDCTGGDRSCTAKYCNETRTRQTAKTRVEKRPRVVKKYRSEPRYAAWSTYKTWEWVAIRSATADSSDPDGGATPYWPDAGAISAAARVFAEADGGPKPNAERERREEKMSVTIQTDDGRAHTFVPSEEELAKLVPGTKDLRVKIDPSTGKLSF